MPDAINSDAAKRGVETPDVAASTLATVGCDGTITVVSGSGAAEGGEAILVSAAR